MSGGTTVSTPNRRAAEPGAWRIIVVFARDRRLRGETRVLGAEPLHVGRIGAGEHHLALPDDEVSRDHGIIEPGRGSNGVPRLRDLGSRNGTRVNGRRADEAHLASGAVVRVGQHLLLCEYLDPEHCQRLLRRAPSSELLVGESAAMVVLRQRLEEVVRAPVPILLQGPSGVGKELAARELHRLSGRAGEFVPVNCAAIPEHLAESELFGSARGAFTGADRARDGVFGEAEGGTILLDEISEMPLPIQAKLLRVLSAGEVRRVGEGRPRKIDVRVIAATNLNLRAAVDDKTFKHDLYARLLGGEVRVPPLCERRDDIVDLAERFLRRVCDVELTPDAAEALLVYDWPLNVRELEHIVGGAAPAARDAGAFDIELLPCEIRDAVEIPQPPVTQFVESVHAKLLRIRRDRPPSADELTLVLEHFDGSVARVAEFFGRNRRQVYRWVENLDLDLSRIRD